MQFMKSLGSSWRMFSMRWKIRLNVGLHQKMVVRLTSVNLNYGVSLMISVFLIFSATNRLKFKFYMKKIKYLKWLLFSHVMNKMTH